MTTVYLIRHAQAEGNLYHRVHGCYDSLLTVTGKRQAQELGNRFEALRLQAVFSSDLIRARQTAEAVATAQGLNVIRDARFREQNFGVWEDCCFGELTRSGEDNACFLTNPQAWTAKGAETFDETVSRFLEAMTQAAEACPGGSIAVVTHGTIMRNVLMTLFGPEKNVQTGNASVTCLQYENGTYRLEYLADTSHLTAAPSDLQTGSVDLWFQPYDRDRKRYCEFRRDAWQVIYGNTVGLDEDGFYDELCNTVCYHPEAGSYAMDGDQVAGFIQLAPARYRERGIGYINFVYLCPEWRNRHLGLQLIGYAVSYYRKRGRRALRLAVSPANLHAIHFYEKLGFHPVGAIPGMFTDLTLMQLEISTKKQ